jgi:hypothetical protein
MDGFCQCMLVLEKLRDNYASADFATQFLEAAIRKADIDVVMGSSPSSTRNNIREGDIQTTLSSDKARELRERNKAAAIALRRTPPQSAEELAFRQDMHGSGMVDIGMPIGQPIMNSISAHTPPDTDSKFSIVSNGHIPNQHHGHNHNQNSHNFMPMQGMEFQDNNVDLNDFLNFDIGNEMWNVPLEECAHGESGGFLGDMNWVDQAPWSNLNTPMPEGDLFSTGGNAAEVEAMA